MSEMIIARRYAKALLDSIPADQSFKGYESMLEVAQMIEGVEELRRFIHNPLLPLATQQKVLTALFADKLPAAIYQFFCFLSFKGRLDILKEVIVAFEEIYLENQKRSKALIQSAFPLDAQMKEIIIARLKEITHKDIIPTYAVHSSMIGGIRIFNSWKLYEYSFRNELQDYKRKALQRI